MDNDQAIPPLVDSLALALVASSDAPILLLNGDLVVIAASASFARAFQIAPDSMNGQPLFALGAGEWDVPQLRSLLRATLSGAAAVEAYEMDLKRPDQGSRRLVVTAHQLDYADTDNVRVLLAVSDVTDARLAERLKDDLLREKAMLFQELQHRVANSLQIIASVLMQSARRVSSAETKGHLFDAHSRVMSVAALQSQLSVSSVNDVALRTYFSDLCTSIGASMIHDPARLRMTVEVDDSVATADVSVSLGLIVTELVINALKHAFPDDRGGVIVVSYRSTGADWALSVSDDGVGLPTGPEPARIRLGASIVKALAAQLRAKVNYVATDPGTSVSVMHGAAGHALPEPAVLSA
jgi:two-component sensor histidine kinase